MFVSNKVKVLNLSISHIKVGTPTFRHSNGNNNFISRNMPVGWQSGSDTKEMKIDLHYFNYKNIIFNLSLGSLIQGSESIIFRPYDPFLDYIKNEFPTNPTMKSKFISTEIYWKFNSHFSIINENKIILNSNATRRDFNFSFKFIFSLPKTVF